MASVLMIKVIALDWQGLVPTSAKNPRVTPVQPALCCVFLVSIIVWLYLLAIGVV